MHILGKQRSYKWICGKVKKAVDRHGGTGSMLPNKDVARTNKLGVESCRTSSRTSTKVQYIKHPIELLLKVLRDAASFERETHIWSVGEAHSPSCYNGSSTARHHRCSRRQLSCRPHQIYHPPSFAKLLLAPRSSSKPLHLRASRKTSSTMTMYNSWLLLKISISISEGIFLTKKKWNEHKRSTQRPCLNSPTIQMGGDEMNSQMRGSKRVISGAMNTIHKKYENKHLQKYQSYAQIQIKDTSQQNQKKNKKTKEKCT